MIKKSILFLMFAFLFVPVTATAEKGQLSNLSLYHLNKPWRDQNNNVFQLNQLAGQNVVIGMVYTKCPHACPMIVAKMIEFKKKANKKGVNEIKFVLASFDVKRDTPKQLKNYMKKQNLNENLWTFLSPPNDVTARELAVALGMSYKPLDDGEFSHSNTITLLDNGGVPLAKIDNLNESVEALLKPL